MLTSRVGLELTLDNLPTQDGTYVARFDGSGSLTLEPVSEPDGYEVGYDAMNLDVVRPMMWLQPGDRVGVWHNLGRTFVDRTVHVRGPFGIAWVIAERFEQLAIWDWANGIAVNELGEEV